ncbi:hypothetical protein [Nocardia nepalensis]|uniref:hypothetical protein n=1 Tax=Nocardia nepalensis TaxID=3375448 RepID=UPI003B66D5FB
MNCGLGFALLFVGAHQHIRYRGSGLSDDIGRPAGLSYQRELVGALSMCTAFALATDA